MSVYTKETQLEILEALDKWDTPTPSFKERINLRLKIFFSLHMPFIEKSHKCAYCKRKFVWIGEKSITFHYHVAKLDKYEHYQFCQYKHYLAFYDEFIGKEERSKQTIIDDDVLDEYFSKKK